VLIASAMSALDAHRGHSWTSHEVKKVPKPDISPNAEP
jgi:hypothetical protein